jgi:hypothetical protein
MKSIKKIFKLADNFEKKLRKIANENIIDKIIQEVEKYNFSESENDTKNKVISIYKSYKEDKNLPDNVKMDDVWSLINTIPSNRSIITYQQKDDLEDNILKFFRKKLYPEVNDEEWEKIMDDSTIRHQRADFDDDHKRWYDELHSGDEEDEEDEE